MLLLHDCTAILPRVRLLVMCLKLFSLSLKRPHAKFKVFNNSGHLLAVILDMEAAQVQGLSDAVV